MISGATRVAAVIGHPVRHSLSPVIHGAAFDDVELDPDWVYVAFEVAPGRGAEAVAAMRTLGIGGLSVTMPHKEDAARACDRLTERAQAVGAVNTVFWEGDQLVGDATDGDGLVAALAGADVDVAGKRVVVIGAGGAARSAVAALGEFGVAEVAVLARRTRAAKAAATQAAAARVGRTEDLYAAQIIVNATPVGMEGTEAAGQSPVASDVWRKGQVAVDFVYHPPKTPFLSDARAARARTVDGVAVLVHQAAIQWAQWTGLEPPVDVMEKAARTALRQADVGTSD